MKLTIEEPQFPSAIKIKFKKMIRTSKINIEFIDGFIKPNNMKEELELIGNQRLDIQTKIKELNIVNNNLESKASKNNFNIKDFDKLKLKSFYSSKYNLWDKLSKEFKQELVNKYIDSIEVKIDKKKNVTITKVNINKLELENIGYMFRNDCFDMALTLEDKNIILSNEKTNNEIDIFINSLSSFYKFEKQIIRKELISIEEFNSKKITHVIPIKKDKRFDKEKLVMLEIGT